MNYFELFGLPQGPSVDKSLLARKYFELQKENHPDYFTQASSDEKEKALETSAAINKAFGIFQSEEKTIEYFLQTTGILEPDEKYELSPDFLMEMMELNESVTDETSAMVSEKVNTIQQRMGAEIRPVIDNYQKGSMENIALLKLKEYYFKKKYLNRILDRLGD